MSNKRVCEINPCSVVRNRAVCGYQFSDCPNNWQETAGDSCMYCSLGDIDFTAGDTRIEIISFFRVMFHSLSSFFFNVNTTSCAHFCTCISSWEKKSYL